MNAKAQEVCAECVELGESSRPVEFYMTLARKDGTVIDRIPICMQHVMGVADIFTLGDEIKAEVYKQHMARKRKV